MTSEVPKEFCPRLCHIIRWPDFQGYGFNLHAEKGKAGQFIGKVDDNSPAEASGLKEGDRIVEVNGVNIGNENHQQVVTRIKQGGEETRLLVVDNAADDWFKNNKLVIKGDHPGIIYGTARRDSSPEEEHQPEPEPEPEAEPEPEPEPEVEPESGETEEIVAAVEVAPVEVAPPVTNGFNEDDLHKPRECHIKLWPHFQGYGFNLHAERDKPGQYIGLVDDNSPASTAGLRVNDRIVEVNGTNIEKEPHSGVIGRIKETPGEARLLVVDPQVDKYYREKGIPVHSGMSQVEYIATPVEGEAVNGVKKQEAPPAPEPEFTVAKEPEEPPAAPKPEPTPAPAPEDDGLMLNLSVAEMKERLKARKKQDPRHNKISFERKHQQFERM